MGPNAKFIVTGDVTQIDLPAREASGLVYALKILNDVSGISMIYFDNRDIVRHRLVKDIIEAYSNASNNDKNI
jgi:phosphate starvation-inducible PhoH-like protein